MLTVSRWLERVENGLIAVLVLAMVLLAGAQILLRNLFGTGIEWADPLLRALVLWTAMLGALAAARDDKHIGLDLRHALRARTRKTCIALRRAAVRGGGLRRDGLVWRQSRAARLRVRLGRIRRIAELVRRVDPAGRVRSARAAAGDPRVPAAEAATHPRSHQSCHDHSGRDRAALARRARRAAVRADRGDRAARFPRARAKRASPSRSSSTALRTCRR